jgi:5-methylcytosine-specific restriction protein A
VAILDSLITDTTQAGYYPVYLFREDFTGVYLSLNQGVTDVRRKFRSDAPHALRTQAINYRAQIGPPPTRFPETEIDLRPSKKSRLSPDYEAGNVYSTLYREDNLPTEEVLTADLHGILDLYETLRVSENLPIGTGATEDDEEGNPNLRIDEDLRKFREHKRIERSQRLARKVKQIQGLTCQACGFDFSKVYVGIANNKYIESHHLTPISELKGQRVSLDPAKDFAVLCANCHRMIHRFEHPEDLNGFRGTLVSS